MLDLKKKAAYLIRSGIPHLLSANLFTYFLQFGSSLLVAGFLTPAELGEMRVLQGYILIFTLLATGGFSTAVLTYCGGTSDPRLQHGILMLGFRRAFGTTLAALAALVGLTLMGLTVKSRQSWPHLAIYASAIPFSVSAEMLGFYFQATRRFRPLAVAQIISRLQGLVLIVVGTKLWHLVGFISAFVLTQALGLWPLLRNSREILELGPPAKSPEGFTKTAVFSALANGTALLGLYSDMFILDRFGVNRATIGRYSLAALVLLGASVVTYTAMAILTPYFSQHGGDAVWVRKNLLICQSFVTAVSLGIAIGGYILAAQFIPMIYGRAYAESLTYLKVLMWKHVLWSSQSVMSVALLGMGFAEYNFATVLSATVVCVVVGIACFRTLGVQSVAIAQVAGAATALLVSAGFISRVLRAKLQAVPQCG